MRGMIHGLYKGAAEMVMPVRLTSAFKEKGVLTPEEFVLAGDTLVSTCPTWAWQAGEVSKLKPYLPHDKQYLITRNVPCLKRASALEDYCGEETIDDLGGEEGEEGWLVAERKIGPVDNGVEEEEVPDMETLSLAATSSPGPPPLAASMTEEEDVPDMEDFEEEDPSEGHPDQASLPAPAYLVANEPEDHIMRTRTYDLSITYDKYYQTPRVWLYGYDESRQPLPPQQALQDVSLEHAKRTVTVETHPHTSVNAASIHPCLHASVMKSMSDLICAGGEEPRVDQYLFLFLKVMQVTIPSIEYDYTMSVGR
mmetsp:Transcript_35911/g.49840  ORF Transcript_35911/g.49840 Transcript_35911/m.49840 type:complete len:310 (-) Transcript_35911:265-1194(-)|eukprot:CAMPEP_0196593734 /NCGR_PEP_ID=MMETSP1081-20130531/76393_1 /TAXON_ID=36882 /ORGANISM="Pyramimonas amylifera, Strain CCMP720" /LENGTH=309 /DNA_ID=CAMNT_0041917801 /DNA_START=198 /DNA_END=1127 /DNA_ORIENTATION=+